MIKFVWDSKLSEKALNMYLEADKDNSSLDMIAKSLGTSVPSVRGKLAIMGEYAKPAEKAKKSADSATKGTKADTVSAIEIMLSVGKGELGSLDKGSVKALNTLFDALKKASREQHAKQGLKET